MTVAPQNMYKESLKGVGWGGGGCNESFVLGVLIKNRGSLQELFLCSSFFFFLRGFFSSVSSFGGVCVFLSDGSWQAALQLEGGQKERNNAEWVRRNRACTQHS